MLATAIVQVFDNNRLPVEYRVLLDGESDCNLMTLTCRNRLNLPIITTNVDVTGLCLTSHNVSKSVNITLKSINSDFQTNISCLLVEQITSNLPSVNIDTSTWYLLSELAYADPQFHLSKPVDILIGAELFFNLLLPGRLNPGDQLPNLQRTSLGWILAGSVPPNSLPSNSFNPTKHAHCAITERVTNEQLNLQLEKFWEIEDSSFSKTDSQVHPVEQHFSNHTLRDEIGRYIVTLPKKFNHDSLGSSKSLALKRFYSLEKRLLKNPELKRDYAQFMTEYESLGHMRPATPSLSKVYHIPHYPVFKASSTSTKLRVVFDASALSTSGLSLNDTLEVGPTVQPDLLSIVLRFRLRDVALIADIVKMYRQVKVSGEDQDLQRIFWRSSPDLPLQEFKLTTLTYGIAPAAFLATRVLNQLMTDEGDQYPLAASLIDKNFYVDDFICSCDNNNQAISIYKQLTSLLMLGGFELHKWSTNSSPLLEQIPIQNRAVSNIKSFDSLSHPAVQTLGLSWHVDQDAFKIQHKPLIKPHRPFTKRLVLSTIASIFDPLGLIAPIIILCKLFMQKLWLSKTSWDEPIVGELLINWLTIWSHLPNIALIMVPRLVKPIGAPILTCLHIFADASSIAYGAAAYLVVSTENSIASHLILAKSKVAPLKPITIPRLELSAALLAARLCHRIHSTLNILIHQTWLWSDSTIVLSWIRKQPREFKQFVSSRYVSSKENAADCISRGLLPNDLSQCSLWWHGPEWLIQSQSTWPTQPKLATIDDSEVKHCHLTIVENKLNQSILTKYDSYLKTLRVMAYVHRCIHNSKIINNTSKLAGPLTPLELNIAFDSSVKIIQSLSYPNELIALTQGRPVSLKRSILSLRSFLDSSGQRKIDINQYNQEHLRMLNLQVK